MYLLDEENAGNLDAWYQRHGMPSLFERYAGRDSILPVKLFDLEEREYIERCYCHEPTRGIKVSLDTSCDPLVVLLDAQRSGNYYSCLLDGELLLIPKDEFHLRLARYFLESGPDRGRSIRRVDIPSTAKNNSPFSRKMKTEHW
jgi:hypothetical protein